MSETGAKIGDRVRVCWPGGSLDGTVKYTPQGEDDSWIVWTDEGTIYHVQKYQCIIVLSRKAEAVKG